MKITKTIFLLIAIATSQLSIYAQNSFNVVDYLELEHGQDEYQGQVMSYTYINLRYKDDQISEKLKKNHRRYEYLIANKLEAQQVRNAMPDKRKAQKALNEAVDKSQFERYFFETYYADKHQRIPYTPDEVMDVASKFFLAEPMGDTYSTRICIGINGMTEMENADSPRDHTLMEALVFEAIFTRLMDESSPEPQFMTNLDMHLKDAIVKGEDEKDALTAIRLALFNKMKMDKDLKVFILDYLKDNKDNIAVRLSN